MNTNGMLKCHCEGAWSDSAGSGRSVLTSRSTAPNADGM